MKRHITQSIMVTFCILLTSLVAIAQEGKIVTATVHSASLEGNLFGDSPDRAVGIYLPPSYDKELDTYYPVFYLLHGYGGDYNNASAYEILRSSMESWLKSGKVKEMILVMPNSNNRLYGSQYTNSVTTGNWGDYIAKDLVSYIDTKYRTLQQRESRAIAGHSMGGSGAMRMGLRYPEVFSCMGGISGDYSMEDYINFCDKELLAQASTMKDWNQLNRSSISVREAMSWCAAFVPNPNNPPFYCDFPFVYNDAGEIVKNQEAYDKLLEHDILYNVDDNINTFLSMRAIYMDCGTNDEYGLITHARKLHDKLNAYNINHVYNEFSGGHGDNLVGRIGNVLEVFSKAIAFEMSTTGIEPRERLSTTWGQIRNMK